MRAKTMVMLRTKTMLMLGATWLLHHLYLKEFQHQHCQRKAAERVWKSPQGGTWLRAKIRRRDKAGTSFSPS